MAVFFSEGPAPSPGDWLAVLIAMAVGAFAGGYIVADLDWHRWSDRAE